MSGLAPPAACTEQPGQRRATRQAASALPWCLVEVAPGFPRAATTGPLLLGPRGPFAPVRDRSRSGSVPRSRGVLHVLFTRHGGRTGPEVATLPGVGG